MALDPNLCFKNPRLNHHEPFVASPVIRLRSNNNNHTILTIPAQGWSIYNLNDHSILSSQKLPPAVILKSPCFSFSIPNQLNDNNNNNSKLLRSRFIYAPIASCPSDPSPAANQARNIWVWIENEDSCGFGERSTQSDPSNSASANLIKTFSDPIQCVNPIPPIPEATSQVARILVLLQSGTLHLTDEQLTTLKTCSIYSIEHPPSISPTLQETRHSIQLVDPSSSLAYKPSNQFITQSSHQHQLIYLSRFKPQFKSISPIKSRSSNKRKSTSNQLSSTPNSPLFSHYSLLEIYVLKLAELDELQPLAQLSDIRDFLDLTISPQGWITVLGQSHPTITFSLYLCTITVFFFLTPPKLSFLEPSRVLSTFCLSDPSTSIQETSIPHLTLFPHPHCGPIKLAICPQSNTSSPTSLNPSLVTLPSSLPLVFLFTSHPNQPNTCLGLVLDLYHQAVLHVVQFAWPTPPKTMQSISDDQVPQSISTSLSSFSSDHLFMCLSFKSIFVLQVLHPPQFSLDHPPTWVEILDPIVKQATLDWIISKPDSQVPSTTNKTILLLESIKSSNLLSLSSLKNKKEKITSLEDPNTSPSVSKNLKLFVDKFNQVWNGSAQGSTAVAKWDRKASKDAELAWLECVINPLHMKLVDIFNQNKKKKSKLSVNCHQDDPVNSVEDQLNTEILPQSTVYTTLGSVLPKAFVEVLLSMCLSSFTESEGSSEEGTKLNEPEANGEVASKILHGQYPGEIVKNLLKTGLVDDKMVRGGVIRALRQTQDMSMVQLGIARLIDVQESELIETIHWVIQSQSQPITTTSTTNGTSSIEQTSSDYQLQFCLAKIVAQTLDPVSLRKAIRNLLPTLESISVLKVLLSWINWWSDFGESSIGMTIEKTEENAQNLIKTEVICLKRNEIPNLGKIYEFLKIILDSKLIELIKFNNNQNNDTTEVFKVLKLIQDKLNLKIQEDLILQSLNGSLIQFDKLIKFQKNKLRAQKSTSLRQKAQWENNNTKGKNKNGVTPNPDQSKYRYVNENLIVQRQINPSTTNNNQNISSNKKKNKFKSTVKISNLASSNLQHFVDYSIEKFSL